MKEIDPRTTNRAQQIEIWKNAPNPMLVFVKKMQFLCSRNFCVGAHFFRANGIYFVNVYDFLRNPAAYIGN